MIKDGPASEAAREEESRGTALPWGDGVRRVRARAAGDVAPPGRGILPFGVLVIAFWNRCNGNCPRCAIRHRSYLLECLIGQTTEPEMRGGRRVGPDVTASCRRKFCSP